MGIIIRQSIKNTLLTYAGFGLGALNTLVLYTRFMTEQYFGLVGVLLSTATLLMPLMAFGIPNTLVKYYEGYRSETRANRFLSLMLALPLFIIVPLGLFSYFANDAIGAFLAHKNTIVKGYVWHIFIIGMSMAYFEVFFAWSRVQLKTTFGTFLKEVFLRLAIMILLIFLAYEQIAIDTFLYGLVLLYLLRALLMGVYALRTTPFKLSFGQLSGSRSVIWYSLLIILGGSVAVLLLEVDRFMINQYIQIENVAYYTVAIFMATVIIVPSRAMHQITYPLTASLLHKEDMEGLRLLYRKSSQSLLTVAGLIYLLILLNLEDLYRLLPENYSGGFIVVLLIGGIKLFDSFLGINNAILYNSKYYRSLLLMGVLLAGLTILLNMWLIPAFGIEGAAYATFIAVFLYNLAKLLFVRWKFSLVPWSSNTLRLLILMTCCGLIFFWIRFPFHPLLNIGIKSILLSLAFTGSVLYFNLSEDITGFFTRFFKK